MDNRLMLVMFEARERTLEEYIKNPGKRIHSSWNPISVEEAKGRLKEVKNIISVLKSSK
jgi:hypothetical protein